MDHKRLVKKKPRKNSTGNKRLELTVLQRVLTSVGKHVRKGFYNCTIIVHWK